MLLPFHFESGWKAEEDQDNQVGNESSIKLLSEEEEEDEKKIIVFDDDETDDGRNRNIDLCKKTSRLRKKIKQLNGGGFGYFMNDKYQVMRLKYSLQSAMARIHPDICHYQQKQKELESLKTKKLIRLAFSEYRNGNEGKPRANRLSDKLIQEKDINILSLHICNINEKILNLKLFDFFFNSNIIQSTIQQIGFNTKKIKLGINQIYIKLQTYQDFILFLKNSPSNTQNNNLWKVINNQQKCDIIQHREYLKIIYNLFNYITNNQDEDDHHYSNNKNI